jgi:feruloyl esterase
MMRWMMMLALGLACTGNDWGEESSRCVALRSFKLEHAEVSSTEVVTAGAFIAPDGKTFPDVPAFCRVVAVSRPTAVSHLGIEVWLPLTGWNERLMGTGNGGFAGRIAYGPLAGGVQLGYATVNTDLGTSPDAKPSYFPSREIVVDWASRGTHEMTVVGEAVAEAFYGRKPKRRYYSGCSTGGEQAMMESQRYPDDYDGILGGAPAHDRVALHVGILWSYMAVHDGEKPLLSTGDLDLLTRAVTAACPSVHGVVMDPSTCRFDPAALTCKEGDATGTCLAPEQVAAVRRVYGGPVDARSGVRIYPGLARGSEAQWGALLTSPRNEGSLPYVAMFQSVLGRSLRDAPFNFGSDVDVVRAKLSADTDAVSTNLDTFHKHRHKFLLTHGWADPIVPTGGTIQYMDALQNHYGDATDEFLRFYLVPGEAHCAGGPGPSKFDGLGLLTDWVEKGVAPGPITVTGNAGRSGLLCLYPAKAVLKDTSSPELASSYSCLKP